MNLNDKAYAAVKRSKLSFNWRLGSIGTSTTIVNESAYNPPLGKWSNQELMNLRINSKMGIKEIANEIKNKWGPQS